jgi:anti-sigma B factor antagonist
MRRCYSTECEKVSLSTEKEEVVMNLTTRVLENGITVLKLAGRMDIDGTGEIDLRLNTAAAEEKAYLVADLSAVDFMASIGIGVLVRVAKAVRRRGGNLVLLNPQPVVKIVLERTHITDLMSIHETMDAASAAVRTEAKKPS